MKTHLLCGGLLVSLACPDLGAAGRPNIVFLMTDDQSTYSMGCYGNPDVDTPNMDRLSRQGLTFDNYYVTTAICMASRATTMTGLNEFRHGCNFDHGDLAEAFWRRSYPVLLREAGYLTAFAGKFGFDLMDASGARLPLPEQDFDRWGGGPDQTSYVTAENPSMAHYAAEYPHSTLAYGAFGRDFIREAAAAGKPFCLSISFKAPHKPSTPDPRFDAVYKDQDFREPDNYGRDAGAHFSLQSKQDRQWERFVSWGYADRYDKVMAVYHQQVYGVDQAVGMIRAALEESGVAGNTVIIFTSDNGYFCGSHGYGSKVLPYEESAQVPMIIHDPRHANSNRRMRTKALAGNIDIAPTILALAGVPQPEDIDGRSLLPLYADPSDAIHQDLPLINVWGKAPTHAMAVVTRDWKYIFWGYAADGFSPVEELYHTDRDPLEMFNLVADPRYRDQLESMRGAYDRRVSEWRDKAVPWNSYSQFGILFDRQLAWEEKTALLDNRAATATTYYVSPGGSDDNPGTSEDQPFRVVQHAVDRMQAGDTLVVLDGFYTGTLKLKSGITIRAKHPRRAVFSGAEPLQARFERHADGVYKAPVGHSPKQVFFDSLPMTWARWPNLQWSENWISDRKWAIAADGTGPGVLTSDGFSQIRGLDLTGAYCFIRYGKGNSCYSRLIEGFDGTTLRWNDDSFYSQEFTGEDGRRGSADALGRLDEEHAWHPNKSKFFLAGALALLDAEGEWFAQEGTLYLRPPGGRDPNSARVLTQAADFCIHETDRLADVRIEGIDFFACSVRLESAENANISFRDVHFTYTGGELLFIDRVKGGEVDRPVHVAGADIRFERCLFAGAQNSALSLNGSGIVVENCVFMENNRHANFESAPLLLRAAGTFTLTRNTFFNNCSDAIKLRVNIDQPAALPEVSFNNIFNAGKYNSDVSGVYMPVRSQHYSEFHHNWIHNVHGNALRLDLAGKELTAHHNVFWASGRGLNIEGYGRFNLYNNTSVHNESEDVLTRNVLNHVGVSDASLELDFPPISDWNVVNNLIERFIDRVGPREKDLFNARFADGLIHPDRDRRGVIPVADRGSIRGNLTGFDPGIFANGELSGLDLVPVDPVVLHGAPQTPGLAAQGVTSLDRWRGAYAIGDAGWRPGSDWMPYGLEVPATMAQAEQFAKACFSVSIVPQVPPADLPLGYVGMPRHSL